jgi:hypothetical protein
MQNPGALEALCVRQRFDVSPQAGDSRRNAYEKGRIKKNYLHGVFTQQCAQSASDLKNSVEMIEMLRIRFALEPRQEQPVQTGETAPAEDSADVKRKACSQLTTITTEFLRGGGLKKVVSAVLVVLVALVASAVACAAAQSAQRAVWNFENWKETGEVF